MTHLSRPSLNQICAGNPGDEKSFRTAEAALITKRQTPHDIKIQWLAVIKMRKSRPHDNDIAKGYAESRFKSSFSLSR
jgi:hypothetical protein